MPSVQVYKRTDVDSSLAVVATEDESLFIADEVAAGIGLGKAADWGLRNLVDESLTTTWGAVGLLASDAPNNVLVSAQTLLLRELGVWQLTLGGETEKAQDFRRWFGFVLLPQLRRHKRPLEQDDEGPLTKKLRLFVQMQEELTEQVLDEVAQSRADLCDRIDALEANQKELVSQLPAQFSRQMALPTTLALQRLERRLDRPQRCPAPSQGDDRFPPSQRLQRSDRVLRLAGLAAEMLEAHQAAEGLPRQPLSFSAWSRARGPIGRALLLDRRERSWPPGRPDFCARPLLWDSFPAGPRYVLLESDEAAARPVVARFLGLLLVAESTEPWPAPCAEILTSVEAEQ